MNYRKIIITFLIILYLEMIYHLAVYNTIQLNNIIYIITFTSLSSLFIDMITNLFNHKLNKWSYITFCFFITILFTAQFINFKFYGNIISIYSIINGSQVLGFFNQILTVMQNNLLTILAFFLPVILLVLFNKRIFILDFKLRYFSYKIYILIFLYLVSILSLKFDQKEIYSANNIYYYKHAPTQSAQLMGLITTMRLDVSRLISNFEETVNLSGNSKEIIPNENITYNVLDIDFEHLINNTNNNVIKNIHSYMSQQMPTKQNDYTGYFAGKNLIVITAEAFSPIAVDPELTPTLYKLVNNGFVFNNFYSPIYYVSTSDGEYVNLLSLLPKENTWSLKASSKNYLPYTYGNVFKNLNYVANAYHNGAYTYYGRNLSHNNMGYKFTACGNGLESQIKCKMWPQSDIQMIDATIPKYINKDAFMTYYMTISGHLEYNFFGNNIAYKNKKYVDQIKYSNAIKAYISTQIELDRALEILISSLDEKGILNDTVIVMSTDHYPYGLKTKEMKEVMNIEDEKFDVHKNHLVIWNSAMNEKVVVDKYASSLDILPTVLNLFGIEYDSRLLMGNDILSDAPGLIIFNDRSWINENGKYNATTNEFISFKSSVSNEYIELINNEVYNRFTISKNILDTDYYKHVLKEK